MSPKDKCRFALGRQCLSKVGRLLRHPTTIRIVVLVLGSLLTWLLKLLLVVLFTTTGLALPIG